MAAMEQSSCGARRACGGTAASSILPCSSTKTLPYLHVVSTAPTSFPVEIHQTTSACRLAEHRRRRVAEDTAYAAASAARRTRRGGGIGKRNARARRGATLACWEKTNPEETGRNLGLRRGTGRGCTLYASQDGDKKTLASGLLHRPAGAIGNRLWLRVPTRSASEANLCVQMISFVRWPLQLQRESRREQGKKRGRSCQVPSVARGFHTEKQRHSRCCRNLLG